MMTLKDLVETFWTITELNVTAREPDGTFIHEWLYGEDINETIHMYHERVAGRLSIIKDRINAHGKATRGGSEMGWGLEEKKFPKEMLAAPITHMSASTKWGSGGHRCSIDIEMQLLTALTIIPKGEGEQNEVN